MKVYRWAAYVLIVLCFGAAAAQDGTCAAIVQQAMSTVEQDCAATGRNQACYGYVSLDATPRTGVQNFTFAQEGDLANVADISSLRLSRLDVANNTWGIALMKLQANLPDALPGQNVTFLMFGDVQVQNAVEPGAATIAGASNGVVNIRNAPATSEKVIGTLSRGEAVTINGRNGDSSWLRIQIPDSDALGWVFATLVTVSGDVASLPVVDAAAAPAPAYTPMQAFYFQTGITQTSCTEAPADGILIQTPEGAGKINLRANDVDVELGSTAFVQAQPSANMVVSVVEGEGRITSQGKTVVVPAGTQVTIPIDANLHATGQPSDAQPYDAALVQNLPVAVLPRAITVAAPLVAQPTPEATEIVSSGAGAGGGGAGGSGSGGGGGAGGSGSGGGTSSGENSGSSSANGGIETNNVSYQAVKVMNLGGETLSGTICATNQPFAVAISTPRIDFTVEFSPAGATQGSWAFQYAFPDLGETDSGSGTYTISAPAADGSLRLSMQGSFRTQFTGVDTTFPWQYVIGLSPIAPCGG